MLISIAALGKNRVIGLEGKLPWHLPGDMRHFRQQTQGGVIVMGRKTFESIGKPLPKRENWILTRNPQFQPEGTRTFLKIDEVVEAARQHPQVWLIGGAEIYGLLLPYCDRQILTWVEADPPGDAFYPEFPLHEWKLSDDQPGPEGEAYRYRFATYDRQ